jgi:hypothetical protein
MYDDGSYTAVMHILHPNSGRCRYLIKTPRGKNMTMSVLTTVFCPGSISLAYTGERKFALFRLT